MDSDSQQEIHLDYLDFELAIGSGSGREYPIAVVRSAAGEAHETMHFPFDELALENQLLSLQNALLRSGGKRRQILSPGEQTVQNFGRALFEALFTGEVRSHYAVSRREAAQQGKGLRLKLRILSPELSALPWEFLFDPGQAEYVCLSSNTPIIRYLELPQPPQPLVVNTPLHILGMVASPSNLVDLDIEREKQRVEEAIKDLQATGMVKLTWLQGKTWHDLQRALRRGAWHIFHFIGHGGFDPQTDEGLVAFEDSAGQAQLLSATHLGRLLSDHFHLRLVVLNACEGARGSKRDVFSSTAAILVRRGIPAVLAMQYEITDRAAIELSRAFYEALADGLPVDAAVGEARKAISLGIANTVEWGTPVLHMRSPNGVLFRTIQRQMSPVDQPAIPAKENLGQPQNVYVEQRQAAEVAPASKSELEGTQHAAPPPSPQLPQTDRPMPEVGPASPEDYITEQMLVPLATRRVLDLSIKNVQVLSVSHEVMSVAFSPDGKMLALGLNSVDVQLWRVAEETLQKTLEGHKGSINSVVFSPNGQILASGSQDTTVRLWRVADGALIHTLSGHAGDVNSVAFSRSGQTLASASISPTTIRLWSVTNGALLNNLTGNAYWATSVDFSVDGQFLASGSNAIRVRLWRVADGTALSTLKGHTGHINSVAFSPVTASSYEQVLASGSQDTTVRLWRIADGQTLSILKEHMGGVNSVSFSPDGQVLASGSQDTTVRLWRVTDGELLSTLEGHTSWVNSVAFSPDGYTLVTGSQDKTVRIWHLE
jgi:sugar lactone lactonase YvrE